MRLTEARVKQIILEEVVDRLIDYQAEKFRLALREECARKGILLTEEQEDDAIKAYKQQSRRDFLKTLKRGALGFLSVGTLYTLLGTEVFELGMDKREAWDASGRAVEAINVTIPKIVQDYRDYYLGEKGGVERWSWDWFEKQKEKLGSKMEESPSTLPLVIDCEKGRWGILPPGYGVAKQVMEDFGAKNMPLFSQAEVADIDPEVRSSEREKNRVDFPDKYNLPRKSVSLSGKSCTPGALDLALESGFDVEAVRRGGYNGYLYMPMYGFGADYVMPISGLTASELYLKEWKKLEDKLVAKAKPQ